MANSGEWIMRIYGVGPLARLSEPLPDPCYLQSFDLDAHDGIGGFVWTADVRDALAFPSIDAVLDTWRQASTVRPRRADGRPNRPLTALTISPECAP